MSPRLEVDVAVGFLGLMGAAMVVAAAGVLGVLDHEVVARGLGLTVGVTALLTGNLVPKLRPLAGDPALARAAERRAGWLLVLSGLVFIAAFLLAPLHQARVAAAWTGLGALGLVAASWWRPLRRAGRREPSARRWLSAFVLLAFTYVLATACLSYAGATEALQRWLTLSYWVVFAALVAVFGLQPPRAPEAR